MKTILIWNLLTVSISEIHSHNQQLLPHILHITVRSLSLSLSVFPGEGTSLCAHNIYVIL
jgi:hypothetical protein